jgi:hypothetical protein
MKNIVLIITTIFTISCGQNNRTIENSNLNVNVPIYTHPYTVRMNIMGMGYSTFYERYQNPRIKPPALKYDSVPIFFADICVNNLSNDTAFLIFRYTSFADQFKFEPSNIRTFGFCCDKNSIEKCLLPPHGKIVFHTMINDHRENWFLRTNKIRVGYVVVESFDELENFENEINEKKNIGKKVYWSENVNINMPFSYTNLYYKYDYSFSIIDSNGQILGSSKAIHNSY